MRAEIIHVSGMTCINCKTRIEKKLVALEGVEKAEVNLEENTLNVSYDEEKISEKKSL